MEDVLLYYVARTINARMTWKHTNGATALIITIANSVHRIMP